jgi:hypothetical protein
MADEGYLDILKQGAKAWNSWSYLEELKRMLCLVAD